MAKQYTREQRMNNEVSHHDYYLAMAENCRVTFSPADIDYIVHSKDEHFNDRPLRYWDSMAYKCRRAYELYNNGRRATSPCMYVCILKAAAKVIRDDYNKAIENGTIEQTKPA